MKFFGMKFRPKTQVPRTGTRATLRIVLICEGNKSPLTRMATCPERVSIIFWATRPRTAITLTIFSAPWVPSVQPRTTQRDAYHWQDVDMSLLLG